MDKEEVKRLVARWYEILGQDDWSDHLGPFFAREEDWADFRASFSQFKAAFPDYRFTIDQLLVDGDRVAVFGTVHGTFTRPFDYGGLKGVPATGQKLSWPEAQWIRLADGKGVDGGLVVDGVARLEQLGVLPAPE